MRWLIRILVLAALATGLTLLARLNDGYVLIVLPGHRVELSLNFTLVLLVLGFLLVYLLVRLLVTTIELPGRVAQFRARRRRESARTLLVEGLQDFFAGRYARAEKTVNRAVVLGESAELGAVIAARAAHELRAPERRDGYLEQPAAETDAPDPARVITKAQLLLDDRREDEALAVLDQLPKKHTAALRLELRARQRSGQWDAVPTLIDQLEKRGVFGSEQADTERSHAWRRLIERKAGDDAGLTALWKRIPERYRRTGSVAGAAADAFHALGRCDEAQTIIERSLETEWDDSLVALYGECCAADARRQIENAERWLQSHRADATLLLALGKLCASQKLWGKAQSYLEASLSVEPSYSAEYELAKLHDQLGRADEARRHYRASLELAIARLGQAGAERADRKRS